MFTWTRICLTACMMLISHTLVASSHQLTIIRHGQGDHNVQHFYSSNPSHPNYRPAFLTDVGKQQVTYTAQKLRVSGLNKHDIATVLVSPLPRTQQTADILVEQGVFDKDLIALEPRIIEMQAGDLEGQFFDPATLDWNDPFLGHPNTESKEALQCRMQDFYNDIINRYPSGHIILVTHGSPSMELLRLVSDEEFQLKTADSITLTIKNQSIHKYRC